VCTSCDQLFYKHSVKKATNIRTLPLHILQTVLLGKISHSGNEYICHTWWHFVLLYVFGTCSIANCLHFPEVSLHLPVRNTAEWQMLSPRLAFMQIHEAAVGKQLRIHGNVVCVPADICTTVSMLPRTASDFETFAVELSDDLNISIQCYHQMLDQHAFARWGLTSWNMVSYSNRKRFHSVLWFFSECRQMKIFQCQMKQLKMLIILYYSQMTLHLL